MNDEYPVLSEVVEYNPKYITITKDNHGNPIPVF